MAPEIVDCHASERLQVEAATCPAAARHSSRSRPHDPSPEVAAQRRGGPAHSPSARHKAQTKQTTTGERAHSYKTLIAELATLTRNTIHLPGTHATFYKLADPNPTQTRALKLAEHAPLTA